MIRTLRQRRPVPLRRAAWALAALLAACGVAPAPADQVLAGASATAPANEPDPASAQDQLDAAARAAVAAAAAAPADPQLALAAAMTLFRSADLRLLRATCTAAAAAPDLAAVLRADDRLDDAVRAEVLGLCQDGLAFAERAQAAAPGVAGHLAIALHLSLLAWAKGPARALLAGQGPRLLREIDAAVAADPTFDGGAPLRLSGRCRAKAPWPVGDRAAARVALQRAVEISPVAIHWLFLGDLLAADGDLAAALPAWQKAAVGPADAGTAAALPWLHELARRRVAAFPAPGAR
jgi:tetratricopeptide (TPR) repeat protein